MDFLGFHCGEGFQAFWVSRPITPASHNGRCLRSSDLVQPFVAPCCRPAHLALPTLDRTCIITHIACHRYHPWYSGLPRPSLSLPSLPCWSADSCSLGREDVLIASSSPPAFSSHRIWHWPLIPCIYPDLYDSLVLSTRSFSPVC